MWRRRDHSDDRRRRRAGGADVVWRRRRRLSSELAGPQGLARAAADGAAEHAGRCAPAPWICGNFNGHWSTPSLTRVCRDLGEAQYGECVDGLKQVLAILGAFVVARPPASSAATPRSSCCHGTCSRHSTLPLFVPRPPAFCAAAAAAAAVAAAAAAAGAAGAGAGAGAGKVLRC